MKLRLLLVVLAFMALSVPVQLLWPLDFQTGHVSETGRSDDVMEPERSVPSEVSAGEVMGVRRVAESGSFVGQSTATTSKAVATSTAGAAGASSTSNSTAKGDNFRFLHRFCAGIFRFLSSFRRR